MRDRFSRMATWVSMELWISSLLRGGVTLCSLIIAIGWGVSLFQRKAQGEEMNFSFWVPSLHEFPSRLWALDSNAIIVLGLLLLILLPILRVLLSAVVFLIQRDYLYFFFSCIVFGLLVWSIL